MCGAVTHSLAGEPTGLPTHHLSHPLQRDDTLTPGVHCSSMAYHADDGGLFLGRLSHSKRGPKCNAGDTVGCGIVFASNGVPQEVVFVRYTTFMHPRYADSLANSTSRTTAPQQWYCRGATGCHAWPWAVSSCRSRRVWAEGADASQRLCGCRPAQHRDYCCGGVISTLNGIGGVCTTIAASCSVDRQCINCRGCRTHSPGSRCSKSQGGGAGGQLADVDNGGSDQQEPSGGASHCQCERRQHGWLACDKEDSADRGRDACERAPARAVAQRGCDVVQSSLGGSQQ